MTAKTVVMKHRKIIIQYEGYIFLIIYLNWILEVEK